MTAGPRLEPTRRLFATMCVLLVSAWTAPSNAWPDSDNPTCSAAMSESRSWISRTLWLGWVGMWFVSTPVLREHQSCTLNEETLASLRSQEAAKCERDWPVWHTTAPVTKRAYVEEANRGKLEMYRLWCRKQEVRIELE